MKLKNVKWNKGGAAIGFAYFKGNICQLEEKQAIELGQAGYVTLMPDDIGLPDDFPGRKPLLEASYTCVDELRGLTQDQLVEIPGIGKGLAEKILAYLKKA